MQIHKTFYSLLFFLSFSLLQFLTYAGNKPDTSLTYKVFLVEIKEEIAPPVWRIMQKSFEKAEADSVDLILIHMNTFGGMLESADLMRTKILNTEIPVYVFIDNNAASAGALISIACDKIFMRDGANIGAATVVNQSGEQMPDKYQSYMRSMMRSTAEAKSRDPKIAEAMVDSRITIEGVTEEGKVLTFTAKEAIEHKYCDGIAETIEDVLTKTNISDYEIKELTLTFADKVIGFLINPMISGLLIMIIIGGIYFELQTPGIGFPIAASFFAALLYFAPHYLEGLAANWEILLFIVGVILIAVEIFAIPGFGVAGIIGVTFIIVGLSLSMVHNFGFHFPSPNMNGLPFAFFIVISASFFSIILSFIMGKKLFTSSVFGKRFALEAVQDKNDGFTISDSHYRDMIGLTGIAHTILRPSGKIKIDNEIFDATAEISYIEKGTDIIVAKYVNAQLFVRKV